MRIFVQKDLNEQLPPQQLQALKKDFVAYKTTDLVPAHFGRDALYDHPHTPPSVRENQVWHLHLKDKDQEWPPYSLPYQRTSDHHLVYCQGMLNDDHYLFIVLLTPNAHDLARNTNQMWRIGDLAEEFRLRF